MTNSYFRRPRTEQVRGPGRVERPNALRGADRVRVSRGRDGRFKDFSSPKIAGQNAGREYTEIANFLEQAIEVGIPTAKDLMQDWGVREAQGLLADPAFMDSLKDKGGEGRVLFNKLNPFGRNYANAALAEGVVDAYGQGLEATLLQDDLLTRFPQNDAEAAQQRQARTERLTQLRTEVGYEGLPPEAQAQAMRKIALMDGRATQILRGQQLKNESLRLDQQDAEAGRNIFVASRNNQTLNDAYESGSIVGTPEQREAVRAEVENALPNTRNRLLEIIGPVRNARSAAELINQLADLMLSEPNGAEDILGLQQALVGLEVDGQALSNVVIGNASQSLTTVLENKLEAARRLEDEREGRALNEVSTKALQRLQGISNNDQLSDREKVEQLQVAAAEFAATLDLDKYNIDQVTAANKIVADFLETLGVPISARGQQQLDQLIFEMNGKTISPEDANRRAMGMADPIARRQALTLAGQYKDGAIDPASIGANFKELRTATNAAADSYAYTLQKNYRERFPDWDQSGIGAVQLGVNGSLKQRLYNRAELALEERVKTAVDNGEKVDATTRDLWYRQELDKAFDFFMSDTGSKETAKSIQLERTEQATGWNEQIGENLKNAPQGRLTTDIFPEKLLDLYKEINEGKPVTYTEVSKWYRKYMSDLQAPDGTRAFEDPTQTWKDLIKLRPESPGIPNDAFNPAGGPMAAPLGFAMTDPRRTLEGFQAGLEKIKRILGVDLNQEQSPSTGGEGNATASMDQGTKASLLAISSLTGNATAYPTMQVTNSGENTADPLAYVINPDALPAFNAIWSRNEPYRANTPALPQVAAAKPVPLSPPTMMSIDHPHAVLIGLNEGTRTKDGGFTNAYTSHRDPLSGTNQGNFSAQQGYSSPRAADRAWLSKLNNASFGMFQPALKAAGLQPGTAGWERLLFNLRDAYVQAPAAVTDPGGLISRIPEILDGGVTVEAIARARANSYINPRTGRLDTNFRNYAALLKDQRSRAGTWDYKRRIGN